MQALGKTPGLSNASHYAVHKTDLRDVTQNTLFHVDRLTDRGIDLSHRQGKPSKYLSPNDLCELNYTQGLGLHQPKKLATFSIACVG